MITVSEATEKIVKRSRYLSEALSKDIINISSLARYMKPEIESMLVKNVSISSIIMALKRLSGKTYPETPYREIFRNPPEISVRTNLALIVSDRARDLKIFSAKTEDKEGIVALGKKDEFEKYKGEVYFPVSSISISLPKNVIKTAGIYYFFIKSLAWERINILQIFTTPREFTLVVSDSDLQRALEIVRSLFRDIS